MWSQLLQKHHLSKKPFDPTFPSREKYEIQHNRGTLHPPPTPPPRPRRDESQFVLKSRKQKEKTIRKSFSVFLQLILFLQFVILLPLLTAAFLFKFSLSHGIPENFHHFNESESGESTTTRCQFEVMGETFESSTTYNWEVIQGFLDGIGNCLVGLLFMLLCVTMLTILYIRAINIFPLILLFAAWTIFALSVNQDRFWEKFVSYFGLESDDSLWSTNIRRLAKRSIIQDQDNNSTITDPTTTPNPATNDP